MYQRPCNAHFFGEDAGHNSKKTGHHQADTSTAVIHQQPYNAHCFSEDAGQYNKKKKISDCQADTSTTRKWWGALGWSGMKGGDVGWSGVRWSRKRWGAVGWDRVEWVASHQLGWAK